MVARVAIFEGVNVEAAQRTMERAEGIIGPMRAGLAGYAGATELFSADGRFISIVFFESSENAEAAEPTFDEEMPAKLGHIFQEWEGTRTSVGIFQVGTDVRA